jgi:hypothetical protein
MNEHRAILHDQIRSFNIEQNNLIKENQLLTVKVEELRQNVISLQSQLVAARSVNHELREQLEELTKNL